jgi:hypothetical protein
MRTIKEEVFGVRDQLSALIRRVEPLLENEVILPWSEQLGRLKVWIEENRIASHDRTSLEQRLEGSSHIVCALKELLSTLKHTIQSCMFLTVTHRYMLTALIAIDLNLDARLAPGEGTHATSPSEVMTENLEILTETLDSLYDLSSSFENPAPIDMLTDPVFQTIDQHMETFDVAHVEAKYPSAPLPLVRRLGNMNIRRRSYLLYQKRKNETSRPGHQETTPATKAVKSLAQIRMTYSTDLSTLLSVASSVFDTPAKTSHIGTIHSQSSVSTSQPIEMDSPDTRPINFSLTSEAEQQAPSDSESSVGSAVTMTPSSEGQARVPNPPQEFYQDQPFECMYCFKILKTVKTHRSWKYDAHMGLLRDHSC